MSNTLNSPLCLLLMGAGIGATGLGVAAPIKTASVKAPPPLTLTQVPELEESELRFDRRAENSPSNVMALMTIDGGRVSQTLAYDAGLDQYSSLTEGSVPWRSEAVRRRSIMVVLSKHASPLKAGDLFKLSLSNTLPGNYQGQASVTYCESGPDTLKTWGSGWTGGGTVAIVSVTEKTVTLRIRNATMLREGPGQKKTDEFNLDGYLIYTPQAMSPEPITPGKK